MRVTVRTNNVHQTFVGYKERYKSRERERERGRVRKNRKVGFSSRLKANIRSMNDILRSKLCIHPFDVGALKVMYQY